MSTNQENMSSRWILRLGVFLVACLITFFGIGYGQTATKTEVAILQGTIHLEPVQPLPEGGGKIQPGTPVKIAVDVENKGQSVSPALQLYVRYALTKPLDNLTNSVIFETEKVSLPPLEPGQKTQVAFATTHQMPSVFDFVRNDWPMREYQAIVNNNGQEKAIGKAVIAFSAYYYPGLAFEMPVEVPATAQDAAK